MILIMRQLSTLGEAMMLISREVCIEDDARTIWLNIHDFIQTGLNRFVQEQAGALVRIGRQKKRWEGTACLLCVSHDGAR